MAKIGVLLMNVGSPDEPTAAAVERYLKDFLTDPWVIQAPRLVRKILFEKIIVPLRAPQSAKKYEKVWTKQGAPLIMHSLNFAEVLQQKLGAGFEVQVGMRYGNPSIASAINNLREKSITQMIIVPLFPQFADATTTTSLEEAQKHSQDFQTTVFPEFYNSKAFIESSLFDLRKTRSEWEYLLFSFHGLPVSHLRKTRTNYQDQCYETAKLLATGLNLKDREWSVSFQSRLGPVEWIQPYTDHELKRLAQNGVKSLGVYAPSFVADGLETLEEIAIEGKSLFLKFGGKQMTYIPCLNSSVLWADLFALELMLNIRQLK